MELTHNLRPITLKLRWASNFAKLPQNSRNFPRKLLRLNEFLRILFIISVITSLIFIFISNRSKLDSGKSLGAFTGELRDNSKKDSRLQLMFNEDLEKSIKEIQAYLEYSPNNPYIIRILQSLESKNVSNLDAQILKTQQILKVRPDYAAAWLKLSLLYRQKGEEDLANQTLDQAREFNGGF